MSLIQGAKIKFRQWEDIPCVESIAELETAHSLLRAPAVRFIHHAAESRSFRLRRVWTAEKKQSPPVTKSRATESIDLIHLQNATLAGDFGLFFGQNEACIFPFYRHLHLHLSPEKFDRAKLLRKRLSTALIDATSGLEGIVNSDISPVRHISEPVFLFEKPHGHAYSHFIWDSLSVLWWLSLLPAEVKVLVSSTIPNYQKEMLKAAGLTEDRIIWRDGREHMTLSSVYVPTFCAVNNSWICDDALDFFASMRLKTEVKPTRLVYFDRGGDRSGVRRLLNEEQVWEICKEYGFERVTPAQLTFAEKRKLFSETAVMVGQFGGGIQTHFLMQPGTSILCLQSDLFFRNIFEFTSSKLRQLVSAVVGKTSTALAGDPNNSDFEIDPEALRKALEQTLAIRSH
ncbi:glycosyltransferase family 61 protein [Pseudomonas putida]|uniref:glycosyltransferase family 61 protein n=1 Tax=Pseudomonas putida TaxID=303 RepID=UPI0023638478|nr:glycosyltransferase family 61 protein [Pseudomonas putida]MDD2098942.1 glycosyltransferase family 61 protein [Pseudomonas putida]